MSEDPTTPHESSPTAGPEGQPQPLVDLTEVTEVAEVTLPSSSPEAVPEPVVTEAVPPTPEPVPKASVPRSSARPPREPIPVSVEVAGNRQTLNKALKMAQDTWAKVQPIVTRKSVQALLVANRFTNHFFDQVWPQLSAQVVRAIPASFKAKVETQKAKLQPTLSKLQPLWDRGAVPFWQQGVVPLWRKGLALLRQRLPENLAQQLTNRFLTTALITTLVIFYWFFSSLTSSKPAVAKPPVPTKPVLTRPAPSPVAQRPGLKSIPTKPIPAVTSPKPSGATAAKPSVTVVPKPVPAAVDLAEVQTQLASAVAGLGDNLIDSVKATPTDRRLKVTLGTAWAELNTSEQAQVAQKLWERSQKLDFKQFELRDSANVRVARSPVIGSNVILLGRQTAGDS